jgi:tetratricopeptide (TPR) repeat protein
VRRKDKTGLARGCRRFEAAIKRLEASAKSRPARLQVAGSYYHLSFFYQDLGQLPAARRALERARDRWLAVLKTKPGDFHVRTQVAACHNLLGLLSQQAGAFDQAEDHFFAALAARDEAHNRDVDAGGQVDPRDRGANLTYRAGVLCNLGHLYRERGDAPPATAWFYTRAINALKELVPKKPRKKQDREVSELFARQWELIHGQPHYERLATQFLEHAEWGRMQVMKAAGPSRARKKGVKR